MSGNVAQVSDIAHSPLVFKLIQQSQYIFFPHNVWSCINITTAPGSLFFLISYGNSAYVKAARCLKSSTFSFDTEK